jgi:hypothetical protein
MIVSHTHQFVFIKTRKTAGTSVEVFLSQHCGAEDIVTPINPHVELHRARNWEGFYNHMPAHEVRHRVGSDAWQSYFRFCIERNPWDKTISHFYFNRARRAGPSLFDAYLAEGKFCIDHPAYTEPGDATHIIVNRVLRYENLHEELAEVFGTVAIPFSGNLGVNAKSECRQDRRHYREVYTAEQAHIVAAAFSTEIALFGYQY